MSGKYGDLIRKAHEPSNVVPPATEEVAQLSKTKDPNFTRTTIYLPKMLHRKLKARAAEEGREMSEIVETLVEEWLKSQSYQSSDLI